MVHGAGYRDMDIVVNMIIVFAGWVMLGFHLETGGVSRETCLCTKAYLEENRCDVWLG